ncbi:MAG: hypothetical protein ACJAR1_001501 [Rubritalea sp.]|jgi:hypothetical protein|tara:strand:- start:22485 stop:22694 length:210 start_codon:yes stop_codon:yes gene_type:complete
MDPKITNEVIVAVTKLSDLFIIGVSFMLANLTSREHGLLKHSHNESGNEAKNDIYPGVIHSLIFFLSAG